MSDLESNFKLLESVSKIEFTDLSLEPKISNRDLASNIAFIVKIVILLGKIALNKNQKQKERHLFLKRKVEDLEKTLREVRNSLIQIESTLSKHKPLSKNEVQKLVAEIAAQPKIVEERALELTTKLDEKLEKVEKLVQHLVHWTS